MCYIVETLLMLQDWRISADGKCLQVVGLCLFHISTSTFTMLLPVELIDHIFSFLQKDSSALKACSKAHRSLSRVAERHLYAHIIIPEVFNHDDLENPHLLDYPRTLEFRICPSHTLLSFMRMIPRMANLVCLKIYAPISYDEKFIPMLRNCLQQSSLQELLLSHIHNLPFSIFDDAKYIKHLTFSGCKADDEEQISSSPSSQLSLETLILSGYSNLHIHRWAARWVTSLTLLELQKPRLGLDWTVFPELLVACSNSLTKLHLDMNNYCLWFLSLISFKFTHTS